MYKNKKKHPKYHDESCFLKLTDSKLKTHNSQTYDL